MLGACPPRGGIPEDHGAGMASFPWALPKVFGHSAQTPGKTSWCRSWRPSSLILSLCPLKRALPCQPCALAVTAVTSPLGQHCPPRCLLCVPVLLPAPQVAFPALSSGAGPIPSPRWCSTGGCWPPLLRGCVLALRHFVVSPVVFRQRSSAVSLWRCGELSHPSCRTLLSLS